MPSPVRTFNELKKNLKKDTSSFPKIKIAVLGDSTTQFLVQAIKGYGNEVSMNFDIYEADYDQIDMQVLDTSSEFYSFKPDYAVIFHSTQKLLNNYSQKSIADKKFFADSVLDETRNKINIINNKLKCKIIYFNYPEIIDSVFGNYANKLDFSFISNLRKINLGLMNISREVKNFYVNDVCLLQSHYGYVNTFDPKFYVNGDIVYTLDFTALVAKNIVDIILSISGKFKKCLILDLDNTLWGGIVGDDGWENLQIGELGIGMAFTELQLWVKQLKERGIILAVSSKNDPEIAKTAFDNNPDMVLSYEDFAVFNANWDNKADNIKQIQEILNIGFDSMVFLDDNPFERNMVRTFIPDITIPELPEDPAAYMNYLRTLNLFETSSFSDEDTGRTELYRQEARRTQVMKSFVNEDGYLTSLQMLSESKPFDKFSIPRVSQLTQRSNQFNLRTVRYTEDEVAKLSCSDEYITISFTLEDKFGHYGLIGLIIMKKQNEELFIDTWIMSCRVLKRTMENYVLNTMVEMAKESGFKKLVGEYLPTQKNGIVKEHYPGMGFKQENSYWILDTAAYQPKKTFITKKI